MKGLDPIGWFLLTCHDLLGHDKTAALIGQPPGDRTDCLVCRHDKGDPDITKQDVINAVGVEIR